MNLFNATLLETDQPNQQKIDYLMSFAGKPLIGFQLIVYRLFFAWFSHGGTGSLLLGEKVEVVDLSYPAWWLFNKGLFKQLLRKTTYSDMKTTYFLASTKQDLVSVLHQLY